MAFGGRHFQCLFIKEIWAVCCLPGQLSVCICHGGDYINTAVPKAWKQLGNFAVLRKGHPIYSGGSTGLTDFFGVTVRPSINQRNCCCVSRRTFSGLRGHWKRLLESRLYNRSHPSPSHTSLLIWSVRLPQNR